MTEPTPGRYGAHTVQLDVRDFHREVGTNERQTGAPAQVNDLKGSA